MPKHATITVEIEPEVKERAEAILRKMGLSFSDAFDIFLRRLERDRAFPPETDIPNRKTRRVMRDTDRGKNLVRFNSAEEFFEDLRH
ncbi:MAG TPA: type II toxin-antitoxin system RelB/DinJ family antitoxin [Candidatus Kapabacteria bacterium]|nr:type II toxin-antitoxin system RelB/DinJ family antitoxin [Candidatus Kapabacteria bacterium]